MNQLKSIATSRILIVSMIVVVNNCFDINAGFAAETLAFGHDKLVDYEIVAFVGKVTAVNPPKDRTVSSIGSCKFKVETEYRGRLEGKEIEIPGFFSHVLQMGEFDEDVHSVLLRDAKPILWAYRTLPNGELSSVHCDLPLGFRAGHEILKRDVPAISEAMKVWAELEDAKNPKEVCVTKIPGLLKSKNEFIWNVAASYQAVHGTPEQRKQTVEQFRMAKLTMRQMLWFEEFASKHYPPKEWLDDRTKYNAFMGFVYDLNQAAKKRAEAEEEKQESALPKKE